MSELISGKEALNALMNGELVECKNDAVAACWLDANGLQVRSFLDSTDTWGFRLKPNTVTINGIEVPSVKYVAHSGGNCVKISCECPEDAAAIGAALRSIFGKK